MTLARNKWLYLYKANWQHKMDKIVTFADIELKCDVVIHNIYVEHNIFEV